MNFCAACHGPEMEGGLGPSLIDDEWIHGSSDEAIARAIRDGIPEKGMVPFSTVLDDEKIRAMVIYIREVKRRQAIRRDAEESPPYEGIYETEDYAFRLEEVATAPGIIWSFAFLPDGDILATERDGHLYRFQDKKRFEVEGLKGVWQEGTGGLLDITLHPDYAENGWIYLCYSRELSSRFGKILNWGNTIGTTILVRGRIKNDRWVDEETIFETTIDPNDGGSMHFGSRVRFQGKYLFLAYSDHGHIQSAQDVQTPFGKVHRLFDDGSIPDDNPFHDTDEASKSLWSYGHRNPQGLAFQPETGALWASEHGPRGGDEINLIKPGNNYGWPIVTYGMNYDGTPITPHTELEGTTQPIVNYTPSLAVSGMDFYDGDTFPEWKGNLFLGTLRAQELHRLVIEGERVVKDELIMKRQGRIRSVLYGPDGFLYVSLTELSRKSSTIYRLVRVK
jgi:glucose/arabinose dehydrogenase